MPDALTVTARLPNSSKLWYPHQISLESARRSDEAPDSGISQIGAALLASLVASKCIATCMVDYAKIFMLFRCHFPEHNWTCVGRTCKKAKTINCDEHGRSTSACTTSKRFFRTRHPPLPPLIDSVTLLGSAAWYSVLLRRQSSLTRAAKTPAVREGGRFHPARPVYAANTNEFATSLYGTAEYGSGHTLGMNCNYCFPHAGLCGYT